MSSFWTNVARYPKFFISSMLGLILIILTPLKNVLKTSKLRMLFFLIFGSFFILLYITIQNMTGL